MIDRRSPVSRIALVAALVVNATAGCGARQAPPTAEPSRYVPAEPASDGTSAASAGGVAGETTGATTYGGKAEASDVPSAPGPTTFGDSTPAPVAAPLPAGPPVSPPASKAASAKKMAEAPVMASKPAAAPTATGGAAPPHPITIETKTTVVVTPPYVPPIHPQETPSGGILTAAIWDDDDHRPQFLSFVDRYPQFKSQWGVDVSRRVTIRVEDSNGVAVGDAPIALRAPNGAIVNLRAHGDGTTYFWPTASMLTPTSQSAGQSQSGGTFSAAAQVGALRTESYFAAPIGDTTWTLRLKGVPSRAAQPALDVAFVVDCTGSMGDEIAYLQRELMGVVKHVKSEHAMRRVRLGLVLYRDRGDDYVTKPFGFTEDLGTYLSWLKQAQAMGGGDMPESVNAALADTVQKLDWAGDEAGRLAILVGDAPPHYYADEQYTYKNAIVDLNARGVKLVTVGASGIDKTTEYLFRHMSAYTGGRYVFLTDDSGVGDSHLVPDITNYQVEHFDRILMRVISDEARAFKR